MGSRADLDGWGKSRSTGIPSPDRPFRSESLYRLSYTVPPVKCNANFLFQKFTYDSYIFLRISIGEGFHIRICNACRVVKFTCISEYLAASISVLALPKPQLVKTRAQNVRNFLLGLMTYRGPGSSVGIATVYGLDDPGIEAR